MKAVQPNDRSNNRSRSQQVAPNSGVARALVRRNPKSSSPPTTLELRGVPVHFPFRPYKCQEAYMEKVLDALLRSENALLESPTGTGKTLCLLCATLAWQRDQARLLQQASEWTKNHTSATMATDNATMSQMGGSTGNGSALQATNNTAPAARVPTIIYASRTHSQLSQVVRELRNTRYRPYHAVLGSREQMCVNPQVKKKNTVTASDINHDCNKLGKERKCRFRNNLEGFVPPANESVNSANTQPVMDMEDLISMGQTMKVCPFYYTRSLVEKAELILVPYNYLFDKEARETTLADIPWNNAVVIFDEAHNLESFASDSASFDLSNSDIAGCVSEVQKALNYIQQMQDASVTLKEDNLLRLKALFLKLEDYVVNLGPQTAYSGTFMMEVFQQGAGITHANHELFIDQVRKVNDLLMDMRGIGASNNKGSPRLEHFVQCLKRVYGYSLESRCLAKAAFYRVYVSPKPTGGGGDGGRTISYWCFAPSLAMEELANLKVRSILVTSGTLSPLPSYSMELGIPFPHVLENPHIIESEQIHVRVIGKGVSGKLLTSSYERRKDAEYYIELGNTLVSLAKVTPAGMLVFFPSYGVMETCLERWGGPTNGRPKQDYSGKNFFAVRHKQHAANQYSFPHTPSSFGSKGPETPWKRLLATKAVVLEPRTSADLPDAINEFKRFLAIEKSSGCILMGVCRGKISEGIDFAHEQSRAVVITGLPFAPAMDPKVKMKKEYLDTARASVSVKAREEGGFGDTNSSARIQKLSGHEWYIQQGHRAVNQAIGRVIRNRTDYGAVLLLDSRFSQPQNQAGLSKWLRPHILDDDGFGTAIRILASFFHTAEACARRVEREMEDVMRDRQSGIELKYEEDGLDDSLFTKVAVIKRTTASSKDPDQRMSNEGDDSENDFIRPDQVVGRFDLKKTSTVTSEATMPETGRALKKARVGSVFDSVTLKPISGTAKHGEGTKKEVALSFMNLIQSKLSSTDQATVKKAIVSMKAFGDKNEFRSFIKCAVAVAKVIILSEKFEKTSKDDDSNIMLLLFFKLLPNHYRKDVETSSLKILVADATFGRLCKEKCSPVDFERICLSTALLLQSVWCSEPSNDSNVTLQMKELFSIISVDNDSFLKIASAFVKLLPSKKLGYARTVIRELNALSEIQKMKKVERNGLGENGVDAARFKLRHWTSAEKSPESMTESKPTGQAEGKLAFDTRSEKLSSSQTSQQSVAAKNPYRHKAQPLRAKPTLTSYIKAVESDTFVKKSAATIPESIKANAPSNVTCPVCSASADQPFVAECGHIACLRCWVDWLKRSPTCPKCRAKASQETLARVVQEGKPGMGAQSIL